MHTQIYVTPQQLAVALDMSESMVKMYVRSLSNLSKRSPDLLVSKELLKKYLESRYGDKGERFLNEETDRIFQAAQAVQIAPAPVLSMADFLSRKSSNTPKSP